MELASLNIGVERNVRRDKPAEMSGIVKLPVSHPVRLFMMGLEGDVVMDKKNHGGADQAVYCYTLPDYAWWEQELGQPLPPGTFGENLTLSDLESAGVRVGDVLRIGEVSLQVTAARIPCKTLAGRMQDADFIRRFREVGRPGFYCRVLQEGTLARGEEARLEPYPAESVTMLEMLRDFYLHNRRVEEIRRYLRLPIGERARADKLRQLERLQPSSTFK